MDPSQTISPTITQPTVSIQDQPPQANNSRPLGPGKRILVLFIVAFFQLVFTIILSYVLGWFVNIIFHDAFSDGFAGLALGLALNSILQICVPILPAIFMGFLLRRFAFQHAILIAITAGVSIAFMHNIWSTSGNFFPQSGFLRDWIIFGPVGIWLLASISYLLAYGIFSLKRKIFITASLIFLFTVLYFFNNAISISDSNHYQETVKEKSVQRGFEVYETTSKEIEIHTPYSPEEISYADSWFDTPEKELNPIGDDWLYKRIYIRQTAEDDITRKFFTSSNKCNYDALESYISIFGKRHLSDFGDTLYDCEVVFQSGDRILLKSPSKYSSPYPYVAKINNTVLVFYDPNVGIKEIENPENYIVDFVRNARVISNKELHLD